ncbi:hypothetical protein ACN6AT_33180 [Streptomyces sp. JL4002]|uniref:hypothetical protein n=1 Tax=Streptomyces sp. JL4002 TaxID=3404781 RepID=UPI003B28995A
MPLRLFHHRDFSAADTAGGAMGAAMGGLFLPLMIYLQSDLGYSPLAAGAATVPLFVLSSVCARLAGTWSDTTSPRALAALGFAPLAGIATRTPEPALVGAASGVFNTTRQLGGGLGSPATGVLLKAHIGDTPTTATRAAPAFPVVMLLIGLACCAAVRPADRGTGDRRQQDS